LQHHPAGKLWNGQNMDDDASRLNHFVL
jgi:hypothetical protein